VGAEPDCATARVESERVHVLERWTGVPQVVGRSRHDRAGPDDGHERERENRDRLARVGLLVRGQWR
jgi:hypothetical protein